MTDNGVKRIEVVDKTSEPVMIPVRKGDHSNPKTLHCFECGCSLEHATKSAIFCDDCYLIPN